MTGIQVRVKAATSLPELLTHVLMVIPELLIVIKIMTIISGGIVIVSDTVPRLFQVRYLAEWSHQSRVVLSLPHIRNKKRRLGGVT